MLKVIASACYIPSWSQLEDKMTVCKVTKIKQPNIYQFRMLATASGKSIFKALKESNTKTLQGKHKKVILECISELLLKEFSRLLFRSTDVCKFRVPTLFKIVPVREKQESVVNFSSMQVLGSYGENRQQGRKFVVAPQVEHFRDWQKD